MLGEYGSYGREMARLAAERAEKEERKYDPRLECALFAGFHALVGLFCIAIGLLLCFVLPDFGLLVFP